VYVLKKSPEFNEFLWIKAIKKEGKMSQKLGKNDLYQEFWAHKEVNLLINRKYEVF